MTILTYYGWAENAQGQIEQVRVKRAKITGCETNPFKEQVWTGRIFRTVREAIVETTRENRAVNTLKATPNFNEAGQLTGWTK